MKLFLKTTLLFAFLCTNIQLIAQNEILQQKITIVQKESTLEKVLENIQKITPVLFTYDSVNINVTQNVSIVSRNKTLENTLIVLFSNLDIQFSVIENYIILNPINKPEYKIQTDDNKDVTINGFLKDKQTGEVLIGASVYSKKKLIGTISNDYGYFSLSLPKGKQIISFQQLGYLPQNIFFNLKQDTSMQVFMISDDLTIDIIVVSDTSFDAQLSASPLSGLRIQPETLAQHSGVAGENDIVQAVTSQPGASIFGDGSVLFYVRGGNKDQNLIFLDEAPVFNPAHLLGFFSSISPDAVNSISLYKSDFPISKSGSLSSILDIKTKDGNDKSIGVLGKISPLTTSLNIDGPIIKNKTTFYLGFRHSQINWLIRPFIPSANVNFMDLHLKLKHKINTKNKLLLSFFRGTDNIVFQKNGQGIKWNNTAFSLRYNHIFTSKIFSNTTLYAGQYNYFLNFDKNFFWTSSISQATLKSDFSYFHNSTTTFRVGSNASLHFFTPGALSARVPLLEATVGNALQTDLYASTEKKYFSKIKLKLGSRLIGWHNFGPASVLKISNNNVSDTVNYPAKIFNSQYNLEIRASASCQLTNQFFVKIAYDRNFQHRQLLSNSVSPFTTLDVWLPAGPTIFPQQVNQFSGIILKKFIEIEVSSAVYYKIFNDIIDFLPHPNLLLNPFIESELYFGKSTAYGFEFKLAKVKGNFFAQLAYTYSRVKRKTQGINNNQEYFAAYDRPHQANVNIAYKLGKRWFFSATFIFLSGMRFSSPTSYFPFEGYNVPVYAHKNNDRLPYYHRLDISANFRLNKNENSRYNHNISFTIYNLYARNNVIAVNFTKIKQGGQYLIPSNYIYENTLIPTKLSLSGFMPSLHYQFQFR